MVRRRWPTPGSAQVYDLKTLDAVARPEVDPFPLAWFTEVGYRPRRNSDNEEERVFWWCLCCNRCLAHSRSAFCPEHREAYNKQRRRIRDDAKKPVKIDRAVLRRLRELTDRMVTTRTAMQQAMNLMRQSGLAEDVRNGAQESLRRETKNFNLLFDSAVVMIHREIAPEGERSGRGNSPTI